MEDGIVIYRSKQQQISEEWWLNEGQVMFYDALLYLVQAAGYFILMYLAIATTFFVGKIIFDIGKRDWGGLKKLALITFVWPAWALPAVINTIKKISRKNWIKKIING